MSACFYSIRLERRVFHRILKWKVGSVSSNVERKQRGRRFEVRIDRLNGNEKNRPSWLTVYERRQVADFTRRIHRRMRFNSMTIRSMNFVRGNEFLINTRSVLGQKEYFHSYRSAYKEMWFEIIYQDQRFLDKFQSTYSFQLRIEILTSVMAVTFLSRKGWVSIKKKRVITNYEFT